MAKCTLILFSSVTLVALPVMATAQDSLIEIDYEALVDIRLISTSSSEDWLDVGLGKTRYGAQDGTANFSAQLAETSLLIKPKIGWDFSAYVHLQYAPEQRHAVDMVEGFLSYHPLPIKGTHINVRAGMFYPPISLEHEDVAWTSPYTLTPSAINSWVGEEVKSTGLEISAKRRFGEHEMKLTGSLFGYNDPLGTLLTWRGWAMHDLKVTAFGKFDLPPVISLSEGGIFHGLQAPWVKPHYEIDNKIGYFARFDWDYQGRIKLHALTYDNRGIPTGFNGTQYAWDTVFHQFGGRAHIGENTEILGQYMWGETYMGPVIRGTTVVDMGYSSWYVMASHKWDDHRFSLRYDRFRTDDHDGFQVEDDNDEKGWGLTAAYGWHVKDGQRLMVEALHINSRRDNRIDLGLDAKAKENQLQISYRIVF